MCTGALRLNQCGTAIAIVSTIAATGFLAGGIYVGFNSGWHATAISLLVLSGVSFGIGAGSKYVQVRTYFLLEDEDESFERIRQARKNVDL